MPSAAMPVSLTLIRTGTSAASSSASCIRWLLGHLAAVFVRLGVQSRVQLANELHRETTA